MKQLEQLQQIAVAQESYTYTTTVTLQECELIA